MSSPPPAIVIPLVACDPFDAAGWRAYVASRSIPALEHVDSERYVRSVIVHDRATVIEVRPTGPQHLELVVDGAFAEHVDAIAAMGRRALALDPHDGGHAARAALAADPDLAPLIAARPHLRVPGTWDAFETGVRAIVGQQVSVAGATTITARIVHRHGTPIGPNGRAGDPFVAATVTHAFPCPEALAEGDLTGLGLTNARMATIHGFARAVAGGAIRLDGEGPLDELIASVVAQRGLGPWTAHYLALRLGHHDAFPSGDLALRRALDPHDPPTVRALERRAARWQPWRALAAAHLWAADAARPPHVRPRGHEPTGPRGRRPV